MTDSEVKNKGVNTNMEDMKEKSEIENENPEKNADLTAKDPYYKLDDDQIESVLFSAENVKHFRLYQKSIELIGIVQHAEIKKTLLKFSLATKKDNTILEVIIWDENLMEKFQPLIELGNVLHLDGLFAKKEDEHYSRSNVPYDLHVSTNSKIHLLKVAPSQQQSQPERIAFPLTTIEDCVNYTGSIQLTAFIKQVIGEETLPQQQKINQGCLSDCAKYKLEIRMPILCDMSEFVLGAHVRVTGIIQYSKSDTPYIWVLKKNDIIKESSIIKTLSELLKGSRIPKRIFLDKTNKEIVKKFCVSK